MKHYIMSLVKGKTKEEIEEYIAFLDKSYTEAEDPLSAQLLKQGMDLLREYLTKGLAFTPNELMQSLSEGKILVRGEDGKEFYFYFDKSHKRFEKKGWGSALGDTNNALSDVFLNPHCWRVHDKTIEDEPLPWTTLINK